MHINNYSHLKVEEKWQSFWCKNKIFITNLENFILPKKYILSMFPYPSGNGLHMGHVRIYTISDVIARFYRFKGYNVFFPIGWDSFGLPAEQYAIKTGNHPKEFTDENILNFKKQLKKLGYSYDWEKELKTSDEKYYEWTQWIFCKIYEMGLAEYKKTFVYWCDDLGTVLSNEEIKRKEDGFFYSNFGNYKVKKREIYQWLLKITFYAKKLLNGLNDLKWPDSIKKSQINWINESNGLVIKFQIISDTKMILENNNFFEVSVSSLDIVNNISAISFSIHNPFIFDIVGDNIKKKEELVFFCNFWKKEEDENPNYDKNTNVHGIFLEKYCKNPFNGKNIPLWVSNYVNDHAINDPFIVNPSFDIKDKFFCQKYSLDNKIIENNILEGIFFELEKKDIVKKKNFYHLRDWVFSRQRYWGEPIPIIHFYNENNDKWEMSIERKLPLILPKTDDFKPDKRFYSPLQKLKEWTIFDDGKLKGFRDVNVMPQWAGSCWYYIAFLLKSMDSFIPIYSDKAKKIIKNWLPVDIYIGGQEHANLHLLYSRFWYKILNEIGIVFNSEPFSEFICQGMILGEDGKKMSKSLNNVINPDYFLEKYGADSLRIYELSITSIDKTFKMGSFENVENKVKSMKKWLNRVYKISENVSQFFSDDNNKITDISNDYLDDSYKKMLKDVNHYYENRKFNLVISSLMTFINSCYKHKELSGIIPQKYFLDFLKFLNPIAPHISEEIWSFFSEYSISLDNKWPI